MRSEGGRGGRKEGRKEGAGDCESTDGKVRGEGELRGGREGRVCLSKRSVDGGPSS